MSDEDFGYLPEVSQLGRAGSELRLVIDTLATQTATAVVNIFGRTTIAALWQDRQVLLTFTPVGDDLTVEMRVFRDDDWVTITIDEMGDVLLLHC